MMNFTEALRQRTLAGYMPVIADIKKHSPKEGPLVRGRDVPELARTLVAAGAPALSVVTEEVHYGGSLGMLEGICATVNVPVLRKDFIQTEEQVGESALAGASAVLLIVAMLDETQLCRLYEAARKHGLTALVETHNRAEMERAMAVSPELVGINNRDILSLEKDDGGVEATERLLGELQEQDVRANALQAKAGAGSPQPGRPLLVSESSIMSRADVVRAKNAGADAVLVGTALLQAPDMARMYRELSIPVTGGRP